MDLVSKLFVTRVFLSQLITISRNPWDCNNGPALITDFSGNPTNYGRGYKNHLEKESSKLLKKG